MKQSHRFAAIAALAGAMTLAGCERDASDLTLGPHAGASAMPARAPSVPHADSSRRAGTAQSGDYIALADAVPPTVWYDGEGHAYQVTNVIDDNGDIVTQHRRDGALFATVKAEGSGANVGVYDQGWFIQDQFVMFGGPQGARGTFEGSRPPVGRPLDDDAGRPMRQMIAPCTDELNGYLLASAGLIAAGWAMARNPTSLKLKNTFRAAVFTFALAWKDLYECRANAEITG